MRFLSILAFISTLLLCTSCALNQPKSNKPQSNLFVGINHQGLVYQGEITQASNALMFDAFDKAKNKPKRLIISSSGGEISAGLELGKWVEQNKLDVEITKLCASSCANYVLPAGQTKYLHKDSVIMWHGSAWQKNWDLNNVTNKEERDFYTHYLPSMRERETALYQRLGVDNLITLYGRSKINLWDMIKAVFGDGLLGWDYSLSDMKRFGLTNIVLLDNHWEWRSYRPQARNVIKRVTLDKHYEFTLGRFGL